MMITMRRRGNRTALAIGCALTVVSAAACSSGGGHGASPAASRPAAAASHASANSAAGMCQALAAQASHWTEQNPTNAATTSAGQLYHAPGDKWTFTRSVTVSGTDMIDVVPWLKLKDPGAEPEECRSPVTASHAGDKPWTIALLFPAKPGVQANLKAQFEQDATPYLNRNPTPQNHVFMGAIPVSGGILGYWTATDKSQASQPQLDLDVDFLTSFTWQGNRYEVIYRDPVILANDIHNPNIDFSQGNGLAAPNADG